MAKGFEPSVEDEMREIREKNKKIVNAINVAFMRKSTKRLLVAGTHANPIILDNVTGMGWYQHKDGDFRTFLVAEYIWDLWVNLEEIRAITAVTDIWYPVPNSDIDGEVVDTFRKLDEIHNTHILCDLRTLGETAIWGYRSPLGEIYFYAP